MLASSWLWHTSRWCCLFACGYLVASSTDAPILNQLVGFSLFLPMIVGGVPIGALSDRVDRRRLVLSTQLALVPVSLAMWALVGRGVVHLWVVYLFLVIVGLGGVVNMTAQRPLIYETVGPANATRALTLESVLGAGASAIGSLVGGTAIGAVGIAGAFGVMSVALSLSAWLTARVPRPARPRPTVAPAPAPERVRRGGGRPLAASATVLRASPVLVSLLGVTVVFNLFFSSFIPLVPVLAEEMEMGPMLTGVLSSGVGAGQLAFGFVLVSMHVHRPGRWFVGGSLTALFALAAFASSPTLVPAFAALTVAGAGQGSFGSMQALLAMSATGSARRGAALGLVSMAIGMMPVGMLLVGAAAQLLGTRPSLLASSAMGVVAMLAWLRRSPAVLASPGPDRAFRPAAGTSVTDDRAVS